MRDPLVQVARGAGAEQPAELAERLAARMLDRAERVPREVRPRQREPSRAARLHDHRAQRVGQDVVQFAGDPFALVGDRRREGGRHVRESDVRVVMHGTIPCHP